MPGQGHRRKDLTRRPVLFFPLYSYLIVYQADVDPIQDHGSDSWPAERQACLKQREA